MNNIPVHDVTFMKTPIFADLHLSSQTHASRTLCNCNIGYYCFSVWKIRT